MPEDVGNTSQSLLRLDVNSNTPYQGHADARVLTNTTNSNIHRRNQKVAAMPTRPPLPPPMPMPVQPLFPPKGPAFASLSAGDVAAIARRHPVPCLIGLCMLFFMGVEYTIKMVPFDSLPLDIGFIVTRELHQFIADRPNLNSVLAAQNTVFVLMQTVYILWTLLVEGRPRPTIAAIFMFTCRGILGSSTQLPLPQDFLGSGMDFPVGNVSFFLFYSGHVAGAVIASLDMRRTRRVTMAWTFDVLNVLQGVRLLATRGHYTIDLAVGVGAGMLFDSIAGWYVRRKNNVADYGRWEQSCGCSCSCR